MPRPELVAEDLRIEIFRCAGPALYDLGHTFHPNGMRITHLPTGHVVERRGYDQSQLEIKSVLLAELAAKVFPADLPEGEPEEVRYSWVVRTVKYGGEMWALMTYRWTNRKHALDDRDHWLSHYGEVRTVEVVTRYRMAEDGEKDVRGETWRVIDE